MNKFFSRGRDSNAPLIDRIKKFLSKDEEGNPRHEVYRTICYREIIGNNGEYFVKRKEIVLQKLLTRLSQSIGILAFYDRGIGEYYISLSGSISDIRDGAAIKLERIETIIGSG